MLLLVHICLVVICLLVASTYSFGAPHTQQNAHCIAPANCEKSKTHLFSMQTSQLTTNAAALMCSEEHCFRGLVLGKSYHYTFTADLAFAKVTHHVGAAT